MLKPMLIEKSSDSDEQLMTKGDWADQVQIHSVYKAKPE